MYELTKNELILQNKGVQKLKLSKNVNNESCSPNPVFLQK